MLMEGPETHPLSMPLKNIHVTNTKPLFRSCAILQTPAMLRSAQQAQHHAPTTLHPADSDPISRYPAPISQI